MERDPHCGNKKLRSSKLGPRAPTSEKLSLRWGRRGAPAMSAESTEAVSSSSCNMTALSRRSCSSSITLCSARLARRVSSVISIILVLGHSDPPTQIPENPGMYHESWKPELLANMTNCNILESGSGCRGRQLTTRRHSCCTTTSRSRSAPGQRHPIEIGHHMNWLLGFLKASKLPELSESKPLIRGPSTIFWLQQLKAARYTCCCTSCAILWEAYKRISSWVLLTREALEWFLPSLVRKLSNFTSKNTRLKILQL
jgi:hypothetical protein